jgi:hypothetical protein
MGTDLDVTGGNLTGAYLPQHPAPKNDYLKTSCRTRETKCTSQQTPSARLKPRRMHRLRSHSRDVKCWPEVQCWPECNAGSRISCLCACCGTDHTGSTTYCSAYG